MVSHIASFTLGIVTGSVVVNILSEEMDKIFFVSNIISKN